MKRTKMSILANVEKPYKAAKIVDNNTLRIEYQDGTSAIRLHDTDIVTFNTDGSLTLNSGGWQTLTTKDRINAYLRNTGYISQNKGIWYIYGSPFYDGIKVKGGKIVSKVLNGEKHEREVEQMKKRINKFCSLITEDNLPIPSNGDCWYCLMHTQEGETWGDSSGDHDHLLNHIEENYLHGSLLVNAMREKGFRDYQIPIHYSMRLADAFRRAVRAYLQKRLIKNISIKDRSVNHSGYAIR
jgi:hypothetical protein